MPRCCSAVSCVKTAVCYTLSLQRGALWHTYLVPSLQRHEDGTRTNAAQADKWSARLEDRILHVQSGFLPLGDAVPHSEAPLIGLSFSTDMSKFILGQVQAASCTPACRSLGKRHVSGAKGMQVVPPLREDIAGAAGWLLLSPPPPPVFSSLAAGDAAVAPLVAQGTSHQPARPRVLHAPP